MDNITPSFSGLRELALFAGAGGGILGGTLLGWETVCAVEIEPYPACVLAQRQNDGILPPFPIWDDIRTFDGKPWRGIIDVVSGGFPCQDISVAGKGKGITGERSGLWKEMARIIREVRPAYAFVENSPALTRRGLDVVLSDLAEMGYDAAWGVLGADSVGGIHKRHRVWILAYSDSNGSQGRVFQKKPEIPKFDIKELSTRYLCAENMEKQCAAPAIIRSRNDVAASVDRIKAIGNGQVPRVAATAFTILHKSLMEM